MAACLVLVLAGSTAAQSPRRGRPAGRGDAGLVQGADAAAPTYRVATEAELAELEARLEATRTLASGRLPEGFSIPQIARIGSADPAWVAARIAQLEAWLENPVGLPPPPPGVESGAEPAELEVDPRVRALEIEITRARIAALRLPPETRELLIAQDVERQRAAQMREALRTAEAQAVHEVQRATVREQAALDAADSASTAASRLLATEEARAEGTKRQQAELSVRLARDRLALHDERALRTDLELERRARLAPRGSRETSRLYAELVRLLRRVEAELRRTLAAVDRPTAVPSYTLPPALPREPGSQSRVAALERLARTLDAQARELDRESRAIANERIASQLARMRRLDALRYELLAKLGTSERNALLGFGPAGRAQLSREMGRIDLSVRIYARDRRGRIARAAGAGGLLPAFRRVAFDSLMALAVVVAFTLASALLRSALVRARRSPIDPGAGLGARLSRALAGAFERIRGGLLLYLCVRTLFAVLPAERLPIEAQLLGSAILLYSFYAMAIGALQGFVEWASAIDGIPLRVEQVEKLRRSLVLLGRYLLFVGIFLDFATRILGHGAVYHQVSRLAWIGLVPIALAWVRTWEPETREVMAPHVGRSGWARTLDVPRGRPGWRLALALSSLVALALLLVGVVMRFALQFESTRSAQAFVLRRKLERRARSEGPAPGSLPEPVLRAFSEDPVEDEALLIDRLPELAKLAEELGRFQSGGPSLAVLVVGEAGHGKSTWALAASRAARARGLRTFVLRPSSRIDDPSEVDRWLAEGLGLSQTPADAPAWEEAFRGLGRSTIVVDDAQLLFRRGIDRRAPYARLVERMSQASGMASFVVTIERHAFDFLSFAERGPHPVFHRTVRLGRWKEDEIRALLDRRIAAAGADIRFDLLIEGDAASGAPDVLLRTQAELVRLVWDYAAGSPRLALCTFRSALRTAEDGGMAVALFPRVESARLDLLSPRQAWVLAVVVWQGGATPDEVAEILRGDRVFALETLRFLASFGAVEEREGRGFVVTTPWTLAARHRLERDHLLLD